MLTLFYPPKNKEFIMDLALKMEQLPETACKLSIKVGSQRIKMTQVQVFAYLPTEEEILDCLEDYGYGTEYGFARLQWQNEKNKPVKSLSLSTPLESENNQSDLSKTLDTMLSLVSEVRRFTAVQNEGNEKLMEALIKSQDRNDELREQVVEERSTALALDLAIQDMEKSGEENYKDRAIEMLSQGVQAYLASKSRLTSEELKNLMLQHPGLIDELVKDEEVVKLISQRIMSNKLEEDDA